MRRGFFSSRGMARKLEEDVAFRVLGAGNFPSHRTLCEFRRRHLEDFKGLFVEVVRVAREMGLAKFGTLSVDGTKVRANASKRKAMSYDRMLRRERELEAEIEALLTRARDTDAREDERFGETFRGDGLPEELRRREDRLEAIRAAKERLEAAQREADDARGRGPGQERNPKGGGPYKRAYGEPDGKAQGNFTDPESAIMRTGPEGFRQCYNAQVAVDGEHQLIVATELTSNANDQGALVGLLDEVGDRFGAQPGTVLADAGYCNERDLSELEARGIDGYVATGRGGRRSANRDAGGTLRRTAWSKSWPHPRAGSVTRNANGCPRRPTAGSRRSSASGGSACGAWRRRGGMGSGVSGAEHQAGCNRFRRDECAARRRDGAETTRIGGPFRILPRVPPAHCALPVSRPPCPSPLRDRPVRPLTFPDYLSTAQAPSHRRPTARRRPDTSTPPPANPDEAFK